MRTKAVHRLLLLLLLITVAATQAVAKRKQKKQEVKQEPVELLSDAERRRFTHFFVEAKKQQLQGNATAAFDLYNHCLRINPYAAEAMYEVGVLNYQLSRDSVGLSMLLRATELQPDNLTYQETLASACYASNDIDGAIRAYESMARTGTDRTDVFMILSQLYRYNDQLPKAIEALDRLEQLEGKTMIYSQQKYNLYLEMEQEDKAFGEMQSLCREMPHDVACRLELADLYRGRDRMDECKALLDEVAQIDPKNLRLTNSLMDYYEASGQSDKYQQMMDSLLYVPGVSLESRVMALGMLVEKAEEDTQKEELDSIFRTVIAQQPNEDILLKVYLLFQTNYAKASEDDYLATMWRVLEITPDDVSCIKALLQYYLKKNDTKQIERLCKQGIEYEVGELSFHYFLGAVLNMQDREAEAVLALETGIRQINEDSNAELVSDMYALVGDIYHSLGRERDAYEAYDSCLVYNEDNIPCLNNYAYFLSIKGEQLDKAEKMSYRTVRKEPNNKTYLDTYAWILFVQGDYEMARTYMERVVDPTKDDSTLMADPDMSATLLEHAGDIYSQCGQTDLALRFWALALSGGQENALLEKKIKLKKYVTK